MDTNEMMYWLNEHFTLDGQGRLIRGILDYVEEKVEPEKRDEHLLILLDAIGLEQSDLDQMRAAGIY